MGFAYSKKAYPITDETIAYGSELITDGGFAAVTEGAEIATGTFTIGLCYKITAHTDSDFTTVGAPDSNVGTYFNATATGGAGILDAGDKVKPITFTNWSAGTGIAPQATAGALTGKAAAIAAGGSRNLTQVNTIPLNTVNRGIYTAAISAGSVQILMGTGGTTTAHTVSGTYVDYGVQAGNGYIYISLSADFVGTIDDVSVKESIFGYKG